MDKILAYGEIMLRISSDSESIENTYSIGYGGCEANALAFLGQRGHNCKFLSSFPDNFIGKDVESFLKSFNIDCCLNFDKNRLGVYYTIPGKNNNPTKISYDRANSSFSLYTISKDHLLSFFGETKYLLISGVTPALSPQCQDNILNMIEIAKSNNIKIIYDVNFRKNLWSMSECRVFTRKILNSIDFLFTSSSTIREILKLDINSNSDTIFDETEKTVSEILKIYQIPLIAMTIRKENNLASLISYESHNYRSEIYEVNQIDRVGAGDSFLGATMHGVISGWDIEKIISFAASSFAIAHTFRGDINKFTDLEIKNFRNNNVY